MDLDLGYSDYLALQQLLSYVTGATIDQSSGQLVVGDEVRFAVVSPHVYHSNLSLIHSSVFFQMCRAHQIGYDSKVLYLRNSSM